MNKPAFLFFLGMSATPVLLAADPASPAAAALSGTLEGKLLAAGDNRIMILNADVRSSGNTGPL